MSDPTLGRMLGSGKEAEVFEYRTIVVKLYRSPIPKRSAFREASILALVESFGLPVPAVYGVRQFGDRWGVMMARADGPAFAEAMGRQPHLRSAYIKAMALLHWRVHSHPATQLASLNAKLAAKIRQATILGETRQSQLLSRLAAQPEGDRLCHGDFHPFNLLGRPGRETLVDWMDASRGDPTADVCRSYVLIRRVAPEIASAYLEAYADVSGESRERILGWLPFVAGARLAEGLPDDEDSLIEMADSRR